MNLSAQLNRCTDNVEWSSFSHAPSSWASSCLRANDAPSAPPRHTAVEEDGREERTIILLVAFAPVLCSDPATLVSNFKIHMQNSSPGRFGCPSRLLSPPLTRPTLILLHFFSNLLPPHPGPGLSSLFQFGDTLKPRAAARLSNLNSGRALTSFPPVRTSPYCVINLPPSLSLITPRPVLPISFHSFFSQVALLLHKKREKNCFGDRGEVNLGWLAPPSVSPL